MRRMRAVAYLATAVLALGGAALLASGGMLHGASEPRSYAPADGRPAIVCLGDSLTAGDAAPADQSYPAWLQRRLDGAGYRYRVVDVGVSGDRAADGLARLGRDVLGQRPAIAIVELGSNDPGHTSRAVWEASLAAIVARLRARGVRVILGGLDGPGIGDVYRTVATRYQVPLVWFTAGLWSRAGLWGDAHHPNGDSYRVVADSFWPALKSIVRRAQ